MFQQTLSLGTNGMSNEAQAAQGCAGAPIADEVTNLLSQTNSHLLEVAFGVVLAELATPTGKCFKTQLRNFLVFCSSLDWEHRKMASGYSKAMLFFISRMSKEFLSSSFDLSVHQKLPSVFHVFCSRSCPWKPWQSTNK